MLLNLQNLYRFLSSIPSARNCPLLAIHSDRGLHFLLHRVVHLFSEHIAQNAANQHHHKYDENQQKVLKL
jgi:hypothetical protein